MEDSLEILFATSRNEKFADNVINYKDEDDKPLCNIKEGSMCNYSDFAKTEELRTRVKSDRMMRKGIKRRLRCGRSSREVSDLEIIETLKRRRNLGFKTKYEKSFFKTEKKVLIIIKNRIRRVKSQKTIHILLREKLHTRLNL